MNEELTVGQVAGRTGLSAHTLRYYERAGLMTPVGRAASGHRRYTEDDLEWIVLLLRLRATGMSIAGIRRFAGLVRRGETTIPERRGLLEAHERALRGQLEEIEKTLAVLAEKLADYRASEAAQRETTEKPTPTPPPD